MESYRIYLLLAFFSQPNFLEVHQSCILQSLILTNAALPSLVSLPKANIATMVNIKHMNNRFPHYFKI